jgi:hypothetical protein
MKTSWLRQQCMLVALADFFAAVCAHGDTRLFGTGPAQRDEARGPSM